jgi:hypothetical protein
MFHSVTFGNNLEFCTNAENGEVKSQELICSANDCLVSFKMDKNFLTSNILREIADAIDATKSPQPLVLANEEQHKKYWEMARGSSIVKAKDKLSFWDSANIVVLNAIAEFLANKDNITLFDERVDETSEPEKFVEVNTCANFIIADAEDYDDEYYDEDYDDEDYDDEDCWADEDDEDDEYYESEEYWSQR